MKVYFYHTQDTHYIYNEWSAGRFPSHLLYGACELPEEGVEVIMHRHTDPRLPRWRRMLDVARKVLFCREHFDAVYATKQNGLDLIILLRSVGLFRKPVVLWHHQPIEPRRGWLRRLIARQYLRGIDHMFMFSEHIVQVSAGTGLVPAAKLQQCPWGADLDFYDRLMASHPTAHSGFISTGKELRDMPTLIEAFRQCPGQRLDIVAPADRNGSAYEQELHEADAADNISVCINRTMWIPGIAERIWPHKAVCICCRESNYTVGLTTLVEALAFGMPVIVSRNENHPFDAEAQGCGICVPYGDVAGWQAAIRRLDGDAAAYAAMCGKSRRLAEQTYNIRNCARVVAEALRRLKR